jgi:aminoglycoside phosphotransferase (APT) family kinase protein
MFADDAHGVGVKIDAALVRRLTVAQFPEFADLAIEPVVSAGTDNALYRLGDNMCARLPRVTWAIDQVKKEQEWLPVLAPFLALDVPKPLRLGQPAEGYPWNWSIYNWIDGEAVTLERIAEPRQLASDLGHFIATLHRVDLASGPPAGDHNFGRGLPLATRDKPTREAIRELGDRIDREAVTEAWDAALESSPWDRPPVWIHGDIHAGNLIANNGQVTAVIDFGGLGMGDPACDLIVAWNLLSAGLRDVFRAAARVDDATWARGQGWALSIGLIAHTYYQGKNSAIVASSQRTIAEVLADHQRGS